MSFHAFSKYVLLTHLEDFRSNPIMAFQWLWQLVRNTRTLGMPPRTNTALYSYLDQPFYAKPHGVSWRFFASLAHKTAVGVIQLSDLLHVQPSIFLQSTSAMSTARTLAIIWNNQVTVDNMFLNTQNSCYSVKDNLVNIFSASLSRMLPIITNADND